MAKIAVSCNHTLPHDRARDVAARLARDLQQRYQIEYHWAGDDVVFKRAGVSGRVHVTDRCIEVDASLGLLLSAMKPTIEREIRAELDRALAEVPGTTRDA
jgi:putative polyhydroxyalkanoate system protein